MGNTGPAEIEMEGIGFETHKMGGMEGPFGCGMENMGRFGYGINKGRINEILSNPLKRSLQSREEAEVEAVSPGLRGWVLALTTLGVPAWISWVQVGPWHGLCGL